MIHVTADTNEAKATLRRLGRGLSPEGTRPVIRRAALRSERRLIQSTPKRTGQTRRFWENGPISGGWQVTNTSKVMRFLEGGTRAHGATGGGLLYIPLSPDAMVWRQGFVFGRDFVLAKRVRGIKAMNIVAKERPKALAELRRDMINHIQRIKGNGR